MVTPEGGPSFPPEGGSSSLSREEALAAIRDCTDLEFLDRIAREDIRSTVRRAADRRARYLARTPGRPRRDPESRTVNRGIGMTDAEWGQVVAYAEVEGVAAAEAARRLIRAGFNSLYKGCDP